MLEGHGRGLGLSAQATPSDFSCGRTSRQISGVPADLRGRGINNHSAKFVQLSCWRGDDDAGSVRGRGEFSDNWPRKTFKSAVAEVFVRRGDYACPPKLTDGLHE